MGAKLVIICALALIMTIPPLFIGGLVDDRMERSSDAAAEISSHVGGPQIFLGPTLAIPYTSPAETPSAPVKGGIYLVFPTKGAVDLQTAVTERRRSLFRIPVYQADLKFDASFDLRGVPGNAPAGATLDWARSQMIVGVSDSRGALADPLLTLESKTQTLTPSALTDQVCINTNERDHTKLVLLGVGAGDSAKPDKSFHVIAKLRFSGAERIGLLPYGKTTEVAVRGNWRDPGFYGAILPLTRNISGGEFSAKWFVPFIAREAPAEGQSGSMSTLGNTLLGVSFVEVAGAYQSVSRSLKYVLLFLGWVFLTYFLFEVSSGRRVHPAQYILVGIAQAVFYLLLLSLAERIGFDLGFLFAAAATVSLLSINAGWIFSERRQAVRAFVVFVALYALIYSLLRLEDYALLAGSIASFLAVAAAMYFTRNIDWYGYLSTPPTEHQTPPLPTEAS